MNKVLPTAGILACLMLITGCQERDRTSQAVEQPAEQPPVAQDLAISLDPSVLSVCDDVEVTVTWDARKAGSDAGEIEIWVGNGSNNKVWIASSAYGSAKTGPWTSPGAVFILKDHANGTELARAVMEGPACKAR